MNKLYFIFCRFIFTEYGKVSTVEGEKASTGMIAELAMNVEETFGFVATRLCRALHSKSLFENQFINMIFIFLIYSLDLSRHRFRYMCCIPAFIVVIIQISLVLALSILALLYGKIL